MNRRGVLDRSLTGTYLALFAGPLGGVLATALGVGTSRWPAFVAAALVAGASGFVLAGRTDVFGPLTAAWIAVPVTIAPLAYLIRLLAIMAHNPGLSLDVVFLRPSTVGLFAVAPAAAAVTVATRRATAARVADATVLRRFQARPGFRARWATYGLFAVGLGAVAGLAAALVVVGQRSPALAFGIGGIAVGVGITRVGADEKAVAVTDEGVAVDGAFLEWATLAGYRRTEGTVTLRSRSRFAGDVSFDLADVPDPDGLCALLDEHLSAA
ncbi:MAG: hypothetical protein ABEJ31_09620 [Haloarculaceae archaeon]